MKEKPAIQNSAIFVLNNVAKVQEEEEVELRPDNLQKAEINPEFHDSVHTLSEHTVNIRAIFFKTVDILYIS